MKQRFYVEVKRWLPDHNNWDRHYTYCFKYLSDRDAFIDKNKIKWATALASDGHKLYGIKLKETNG